MNFCKFSHQGLVLSKSARDILSNSPWTRTSDQIEAVSLQIVWVITERMRMVGGAAYSIRNHERIKHSNATVSLIPM